MNLSEITGKPWLIVLAITAAVMFLVGLAAGDEANAATGGIGITAPASEPGGHGDANPRSGGGRYDRIWDGFNAADKRWAHRTSDCESGGDPKAIGGGGLYRGAFQFMRSTWKSSPKSPGGDPIAYPYRTQAVVAVVLKHRLGTGPWPVCG